MRSRRARFSAEVAMRSVLCRAVSPGLRAEILRVTIVDHNAEVIGRTRTSPVTAVNGSSPIRSIVRVLFCAPSADKLIFLLDWLTT